jgi:hypothetical protein
MLSQWRSAPPVRNLSGKLRGERSLRGGLAQGRSAIPEGPAARVKPPIHEAG